MLKAFTRFLQQLESAPPAPSELDQLRSSVAYLVYEAARVDLNDDPRERPATVDAIVQMLGMDAAEAGSLLEQARAKAGQLTSYYPVINVLKRALSLEQRILLIESLWRVAYADGTLHGDEDHFVRKIAHLLYVPNTQVMLARGRARETG